LVRELQAAAVEYAVIGMAPGKTAASLIEDAAARIDALEQEAARDKDHAITLELAGQNDEVAAKAETELAGLNELRRLVEAFADAVGCDMYDAADVRRKQDRMIDYVCRMGERKQ
jgi:hypothetical protein